MANEKIWRALEIRLLEDIYKKGNKYNTVYKDAIFDMLEAAYEAGEEHYRQRMLFVLGVK